MMSPFVAPIALPFALTLALYAVGRGVPGLRASTAWPAVCALIGFLAGYLSLEGVPPLVPVASKQKFFAIAVGAAALPVCAGLAPRAWAGPAAAILWALIAAAWIGVRRLGEPATVAVCGLLAVWVAIALVCLARLDRRGAASAVAPIIAAGAGFSFVALHGASASLSLLSASVAAGAGAIALVAALSELFGSESTALGVGALSVFAVVLMAVAAALVWFTPKADLGALALAALAPVAGLPAAWFLGGPPGARGARWRALVAPAFALLLAAIPVATAALMASRSASLD